MKPCILFLDDDKMLLESMKRMLHKQSRYWNMYFMDNVDQAYALLLSMEFSVIVCDIGMPVIDGITFIELCKRAFPFTTRIMLSGNPSMATAIEAVNRGQIYAYLNKPVDASELVECIQRGIGHHKALNELKQNANNDGLTGLLNRKQIDKRLEQEVNRSKRYQTPLCILMLDIDHFKKINDRFGHITGDAVLKDIAKTIKKTIRQNDYCGRFGGEEFLIILPETGVETGYIAAERIRHAVAALTFHQKELQVTISGGLAQLSEENTTHFIEQADQMLYASKSKGRNKISAKGIKAYEQHSVC